MRTRIISLLILSSLLLTLAFASVGGVSAAATCSQYHAVVRGENLSKIARAYNTTVAALKSLNNIVDVNKIYAGQTLCVKGQSDNGGNNGGSTYVVQPGDNLSRIARKFGVRMDVLASLNNITNVNRIFAGQTLTIPDVTIQ